VLLLAGESIAQKETFQFQLMQLVYEIEQLASFPNIAPRNHYFLIVRLLIVEVESSSVPDPSSSSGCGGRE